MQIFNKTVAGAAIATSLSASFLLWNGVARADVNTPLRLAAVGNDVVRVPRGGKVQLPLTGITRVITEDDEIARASFQNGRAVLEGVSSGDTTIEVYQGTDTPKLFSVSVHESSEKRIATASPAMPAVPSPAPATVAPVTDIAPLPQAPVLAAAPAGVVPAPLPSSITPARSPLVLSLAVAPAPGNPAQALFTISYANPGTAAAQDTELRFTLDNTVSYVTGSASGNARYDAAQRQVVWQLGTLAAGTAGQRVTLRVEPIERRATKFDSTAQIEDSTGSVIFSNQVTYSTSTTPLLTVFALPDRFLAGRTAPVLVDVKGSEFQSAVDRLQNMGVISGREPGLFYPAEPTMRAEYAVMTLNGLNLRDLRDLTQIKFVLGRKSTVNLTVQDASGKIVATLVRDTIFEPGEHTAVWNGRVGTGFASPGRYTYVCQARDARKESTVLKGQLTVVPQNPLEPIGRPTFVDVKPSDWYAGYLSVGEKQGLLFGYEDKSFRPTRSISRVEATAIVVRALGLEDLARQWQSKDVGFLDYQNIEPWARGYVAAASTVAKTSAGKSIIRGYPSNFFQPNKNLRRDEAAIIVQRLIDRETNRRVWISGAMVPGATVTINSRTVEADDQGRFQFSIDTSTSQPTTVAVIDARGHNE